MDNYTLVLQHQLKYFKRIMTARIEKYSNFDESMHESLFLDEPSPLDVLLHGFTNLNYACQKLMHPDIKAADCEVTLVNGDGSNLCAQLIDIFTKIFDYFTQTESSFLLEDKSKLVDTTFPDLQMELQEWLALNIFHTVGHIAQSMRLQGVYLRQKGIKVN